MEKYVYRVMNELEETSNLILSKDYFDYSPYIAIPKLDNLFGRDGLDNIAALQNKEITYETFRKRVRYMHFNE